MSQTYIWGLKCTYHIPVITMVFGHCVRINWPTSQKQCIYVQNLTIFFNFGYCELPMNVPPIQPKLNLKKTKHTCSIHSLHHHGHCKNLPTPSSLLTIKWKKEYCSTFSSLDPKPIPHPTKAGTKRQWKLSSHMPVFIKKSCTDNPQTG